MEFTIGRLCKRLEQLVKEGHARKPVVIDKPSFTHNCESDGVTMLPIAGIGIVHVLQCDGDGGTKIKKDGSESHRQCLVLVGCDKGDSKGEIVRAQP